MKSVAQHIKILQKHYVHPGLYYEIPHPTIPYCCYARSISYFDILSTVLRQRVGEKMVAINGELYEVS